MFSQHTIAFQPEPKRKFQLKQKLFCFSFQILTSGVIYLHCSQRVFSEYDYPTNMQFANLQQTKNNNNNTACLMEKHVKELFFSR